MKRIKSFLKIFSFFTLSLIIISIAAISYLGSSHFEELIKPRLEDSFSTFIKGEVRIGSLNIAPWSLTISAKDIMFLASTEQGVLHEVHISEVKASFLFLSLLDLYSGSIKLSELMIKEPTIQTKVTDVSKAVQYFSPAKTPKRGFQLGIFRLDIIQGQWIFQEDTIPLDISAHDLEFAMRSLPLSQEGSLMARLNIKRGWNLSNLEGSLHASFKKSRDRIQILDLTFQDGRSRLHATGEIPLEKDQESRLQFSSVIDSSRLIQPLLNNEVPLEGMINITGSLTGKLHDPMIEGDLSIPEWLFDRMKGEDLKSHFTISRKDFRVAALEAFLLGGSIKGSISGNFEGDQKLIDLDLLINSLDLQQIEHFIERSKWNVQGLASGKVKLRMNLPPLRFIDGEVKIDIQKKKSKEILAGKNIEGEILAVITKDEILLQKAIVQTGSTILEAQGTVYPLERNQVLFTLESSAIQDEISFLNPFLEKIEKDQIRQGIKESLGGMLQASGKTEWDEGFKLSCEASFFDLSFFQYHWGKLSGTLSVQGKKMRFESVQWNGPQGNGSLSGSITLKHPLEYQWEGEVKELRIESLLPLLEKNIELRGSCTFPFSFKSHSGKYQGHLSAEMHDVEIFQEIIDSARGNVEIVDRIIRFPDWRINKDKGTVSVNGEYRIDEKYLEMNFEGKELDATDLSLFHRNKFKMEGQWNIQGRVSIKDGKAKAFCEADSGNVTLGPMHIGKLSAQLEVDQSYLFYSIHPKEWNANMKGIILLENDFPFEGTVTFDEMDYSLLQPLMKLKKADLSGKLTGKASFQGELKNLKEIGINGEISDFEIQAAQNIYKNASPLNVYYSSGTLRANDLKVDGDDTELLIDILINVEQDKMNLTLLGNFDLNIIDTFTKNISSSGKGEIMATADGPFFNPNLSGTIKIRQGNIRHFSLPYPILDLSIDGYFDRDFLVLPSISFEFAKGKAQGDGIVSIQKLGYDAYSLELSGKDIAMKFPDGMKYFCDPELLIRGDRSGAIISGDVSIIRGLFFKDFGLESDLMNFKSREYQPFSAQQMPEDIFLDLDIQIDEGFWVRNDLGKAELTGYLHVAGDLNRIEISGRLSVLEGGTFEIRDVEYEIRSGSIDFADPTAIFPSFDITAYTEVSDYEIILRVFGNMEKFDYQLTSDPVLPSQDIIALLITGTTLESLDKEGRSSLPGDLAAGYLAGSYTKKLEKKLQKELGLEKFRIDPLLVKGQTDPTARLTFGKKLSDQLMFIYSNNLDDSEKDVYQMEYSIRRNLNFIAERTELGALVGSLSHRMHFTLDELLTREGRENDLLKRKKDSGKVSNIAIDTEGPVSKDKLLKKLPFKKGKPYQRKLVLEGSEKLKRYLVQKGFLFASVEHHIEETDSGYHIHYHIEEGKKTDIHLEGISKKEEKKMREIITNFAAESIFPQELIQDIEDLIDGHFRENGYYNVDVFMKDVDNEDRKDLTYSIDKGDHVKVNKVIISGNEIFDEERILKQMLIDESSLFGQVTLKPSILHEDLLAVENLYRENGYALVEIEEPLIILSAEGKHATIKIHISEGPLVSIKKVTFQGQEGISMEELYKKISSHQQTPLKPSFVKQDELRLQQYYDSRGFPDARVTSRITLNNSVAMIEFRIIEGQKIIVGEISIAGNERTRTKIIERELLFKPGEDLKKEAMLQSKHALYKLGLFNRVSIDRLPSQEPGKENISVHVEEADNIQLSYGGGFDNQSGPRGHIEISNTNIFGYNRFVSLLLRGSDEDRRVQVLLKEPRLFARKIEGLFSSYLKREERESYTERTVATTFQIEKKWTSKLTSYFNYRYENKELSDLQISLRELREDDPRLQDIKLSSFGFDLIQDARDDPFNPKKGTYASMDWRVYSKTIASEVDFAKTFLHGSHFKNLGKDIVLASSARLGASQGFSDTEAVPLSERFFGGGDSTIRGFERDEVGPKDPITGEPVGGEAVFLINEELRFPLFANFKGVLFYDAGNVYFSLEDLDPFDLRHVIGVGLRVNTPIGPLRFEYGRKLDREEGESSGEFFVSIGQPF
jgi:outer membrane protein assembly complex protein YaeT